MTREEFLARVRRALHRQEGSPIEGPPAPPEASRIPEGTDAAAGFMDALTAAGWSVRRASDLDEAARIAGDIASAVRAGAWACSHEPAIREIAAALHGEQAVRPEDADIGLTGARCGIVSTGTVVLDSEAGRLAGLLPMHHVVVIRMQDVVPTLADAYARYLDPADLPSAWVQVSGPSRTADIELTLTTGVHGPGHVYAIVVG